MKSILIVGSGKSSIYLIEYLSEKSKSEDFSIVIADQNLNPNIENLLHSNSNISFQQLDITNEEATRQCIEKASVVVSMLPARFHIIIAKLCLEASKHMVTASYITPEMLALDKEVKSKRLAKTISDFN